MDESSSWSSDTVAVVTGGNKGIGYEIVKGLALRGVTTVLTARDQQRGKEAVDLLKKSHGLGVRFHELDVTSSSSVQQFAKWLKDEFGGIDVVVNNAGVAGYSHDDPHKLEKAKLVLDTNYYGVRRVTEALLPLLESAAAGKNGARIINVSSSTSRLDYLAKEELRRQISDVDNLSNYVIESFVVAYLDDVKEGKVAERGWNGFFGSFDYCVSKIVLNAYTRRLARDLSRTGMKFFVNCICPGLTSTDMTFKNGHSPELGADTAVWLALLPEDESKTGKFFVNRTEVGFDQIPFFMNDLFTTSLEEVVFNESVKAINETVNA